MVSQYLKILLTRTAIWKQSLVSVMQPHVAIKHLPNATSDTGRCLRMLDNTKPYLYIITLTERHPARQ